MLNVNSIKMEIARGLQDYEVAFEQMEDLIDAVAAINRFNEEKNSFIRDSYAVAKTNAEAFISQWKITNAKKVQEVIQQKENKRQEEIKKQNEAQSLIPKLSKQYKELKQIIDEMLKLDEYSIKSPFGIYSNNRQSNEDIISNFDLLMKETIKGAKK